MRLAISPDPASYGFTSIGTSTVACMQPTGVFSAWGLMCSSDPAAPSVWTRRASSRICLPTHLATALVNPWTATHDFGGLGKSAIPRCDGEGNVAIWEMTGTSVTNSSTTVVGNAAIATWTIIGIGDFKGDGKSDFLWRDNSGNLSIWEMDGTQIINASAEYVRNVSGCSVVGIGE
jgi:hypothetical protein